MSITSNIISFFRTKGFQFFWEKLFHISKIGMNFWGGASIYHSGEIYALQYAKTKLQDVNTIIIFDVGANYGQFALSAFELFPGKKLIFSFEPSRFTFNKLNKSIREKGVSKLIIPYNFGFGAANEKLTLYTSGQGSSIASVYNLQSPSREFKAELSEEIIIRTIDDFCSENKINRIDYLKIDIEGHEYQALLGAKEILKTRKIRFIQFEFGECHIDSRTFFKDFYDLLSDNYNFFRIVSNGLRSIKKYSTDLEVFNTVNYLAELKQNIA